MPNILTILRLLACPILIYLFNSLYRTTGSGLQIEEQEVWEPIFIVFILACLTDFFDGYIARKRDFKSSFGKVLDPIADKALIITMFVMLSIHGDFHTFNKIAFYIIILRELIISSLRFNLSSTNQIINVTMLSKYKTFIQMLAIGFYILHEYHIYFVAGDYYYGQLDGEAEKLSNFIYSIAIFSIWVSAFVTCITGIQHFKTYLKLKK